MDGGGDVIEEEHGGSIAPLPLFRPQVLAEQQSQWLGSVVLRPRTAHRWFAACALLCVLASVGTLFGASYTRTAHVGGWLVPRQGMLRVVAPRGGVASAVLVREGEQVRQGQPLMRISTEERSTRLGDTQVRIAEALAAQRDSLNNEQARSAQSFARQRNSLQQRLAAMASEQHFLEQEIGLQKERVRLAGEAAARLDELQRRGFVAAQQVQTAQEARLDQAARLSALERSGATLGRERLAMQGELDDLPQRQSAQDALLARGLAAIGRDMAESEARREVLIAAPQAGTVTAILVNAGAAVNPGGALLSILPQGATLEAHLYAPSRAIGFVRPGQAVLLRFQAYPYQQFGQYKGVVANLSRAGIGAAELPPQFAAAANSSGAEQLYRITVALARQDVSVYGRAVPLQSGMQLDADVTLERRRLVEWVLEPLFTLTGKWQQ